MKKEEFEYERDEYLYDGITLAGIAAACWYFDLVPIALFVAGTSLILTIIGICIQIWIRKHY